MKFLKKKSLGFLTAALCAGILTACSGEKEAGKASGSFPVEGQTSKTVMEDDQTTDIQNTRVIVDHAGNEVELPKEINRIVITTITPLPSVYSLFDDSAEKLVGMSPSSMAAAKNSLMVEVMPEIEHISTGFMQGNEVNIEELLSMKPDVVFYREGNDEEYEKLKEAGIPAVCFSTSQWGSNAIETFEAWVELLGNVLGQEDKAAGITDYGREIYNLIQERTADIPEEEKPENLWIYKYPNETIQTSGASHFGAWWSEASGAVNAASDQNISNPELNMEQIYTYDPDKIFITNFAPYLEEDLYQNVIEGHDWSVVRAVQEQEVYKCPLGMYRWYAPSSDTPLMLMWMAKQNHPERFADIDLEKMVEEYYEHFYGISLNEEQMEQIFNPVREAAGV